MEKYFGGACVASALALLGSGGCSEAHRNFNKRPAGGAAGSVSSAGAGSPSSGGRSGGKGGSGGTTSTAGKGSGGSSGSQGGTGESPGQSGESGAQNASMSSGAEAGSDGAGGHGGSTTPAGAGGQAGTSGMAGAAGTAGATGCGTGTHNCSGTCVSDDSIDHCGGLCDACPTTANGQAVCVDGQCDIDCGTHKKCGSVCTDGCCTNDDCPAVSGKTGQCDSSSHACSYDCSTGYKPCGAGQCIPNDQCCTESDCPGACKTCSGGACVAVKSADDSDSCAGTCDAAGTCKSKRGQTCATSGNGCVAGSTCAPDGYCCDTACGNSCQACDISGSEGTCTALASGTPHGNRALCAGSGECAGSCTGKSDGTCNYSTSNCGAGPMCSGTDFVGQGKCSAGSCNTPAAKSCNNGLACVGTACKTSCSADSDCLSGYFCQSGTCHLDAVAVGMGGNFGTAVLSDGSVYAWGYNAQGSVGPNGPPGDGSGTGEPIQNSPVKVTGLGAAKSLAAGGVHVCALLANGEVWCWGSNASGQLGNGTVTTNYNPTPSKVTGLPSGVTAISGGDYATCALVGASGDVYCWGNNYYGIFGTNTTATTVSTPVKIAGLGKVTQLSVSSHACVVVGSTEYCWGNNSNSECGQPSSTYAISTPVAIGFGMLGAPQLVSATGGHSCSLLSGGGVYCWGWNVYGDLGDPNSTVGANVQNPVPVATLTGVSKLATDSYSNCAVLTNGKVRCWGVQRFGALGDGHTDTDGYVVTPVEVGGVSSATAISMNQGHTLVLLANGAIKSWGEGAVGELGNSMSSHSATAVDVTATW